MAKLGRGEKKKTGSRFFLLQDFCRKLRFERHQQKHRVSISSLFQRSGFSYITFWTVTFYATYTKKLLIWVLFL